MKEPIFLNEVLSDEAIRILGFDPLCACIHVITGRYVPTKNLVFGIDLHTFTEFMNEKYPGDQSPTFLAAIRGQIFISSDMDKTYYLGQ